MKKIFTSLLFLSIGLFSTAQCSSVGISISSSDETYVQLYHAGFFNIPSGFDNFCEWEVLTLSGDLVHETTTTGSFEDQSFMLFEHNVPTTDSMQVTLAITNLTEGLICTIIDTLYWQETEVIPDVFIYNWAVLGNYVGFEEEITSVESLEGKTNFVIYPTVVDGFFQLDGKHEFYNITIFNPNGQLVANHPSLNRNKRVDISTLPAGLYLIRVQDNNNRSIGVRRIIKQ